ncbi:hypothetical protein THOM_3168 [Trachipleistophora hominis]|uniref:Uncharacterized protein n=1 Tax=Trachipleistophora hominis TaxID=72359 RepID=L7JR29_TRAHO|nr:hypothetical protein THOM_3168 [Trachipleistophora hominis]
MSEHPEASKHDDEEEQQQSSGTSFLKVILVLLFIVAGIAVVGIVGYVIYNAYFSEAKKGGTELRDAGGFKAESNFAPNDDKPKDEEEGSKKKKKDKSTSLREGLDMRNSQMIMANKEVPMTA